MQTLNRWANIHPNKFSWANENELIGFTWARQNWKTNVGQTTVQPRCFSHFVGQNVKAISKFPLDQM